MTCHLLSKLYFDLQRIQFSAFRLPLVLPSSTIIRGFASQSLIVRLLYQPFEDVIRLLARKFITTETMSSHRTGAFISFADSSTITGPPAAFQKAPRIPDPPSQYELDDITNGPSILPTTSGTQTPKTPDDLEMSRPPSPIADEVDALQTLNNPPMNKWRLLSCCCMCFANGLNDSAPGALIPYMEKDYNIGYAIVSLIFVTNAIGFISAAPLTQILQARLGRAKLLVLAEATMMAGYTMLVIPSRPFPVVVLAFLLLGLGIALNLACNNVFVANLANSTTTLGWFHGAYGIGGTIGPLIATALVSHGAPWSTFYFLSLAISFLNLILAYFTFRTYEIDNPPSTSLARTVSGNSANSKSRLLKQSLKNKTTLLGALFIFAYQGAEVSISGWVISFLISYRHSSPSKVGYVTAGRSYFPALTSPQLHILYAMASPSSPKTSLNQPPLPSTRNTNTPLPPGFWGGITLGRFALSHPAHLLGETLAVTALILGALAFQLLVWLLPNVIGEAVAVSIVGLLLGPVYPCATAVFSRLIERRLQMTSLAFVSALGSSGGAVAPLFTGLVAGAVGTWVLVCLGGCLC